MCIFMFLKKYENGLEKGIYKKKKEKKEKINYI